MGSDLPLDGEEFLRWRAEADRALMSARVQATAGLDNWACFAAEQAAQLAMKALLHGVGRAPWGHDLVRLGADAGDAGLDIGEDVQAALRRLARHYIPARYPDAHPEGSPAGHYGASDSEEAIADAATILGFTDRIWTGFGG